MEVPQPVEAPTPVVPEPAVVPDPDSGPEDWPRHREVYLQACTRPGAKLPHAWLVGPDGRARAR